MNERTHFIIKNIYLTLYSQNDVGCVWRMSWSWRRGQTVIFTQISSFNHNSTSSSSWLGCSTVGHWGPKLLSLPLALNSASCPQLTQTPTEPSHLCPGYIFVWHPPASVVLPRMHGCISWLSARSRVNMLHKCLRITVKLDQLLRATWLTGIRTGWFIPRASGGRSLGFNPLWRG